MTTTSHVAMSNSAFKASRFRAEMKYLFASVSGHNLQIEYHRSMVALLDKNDPRLLIWNENLNDKTEILSLKRMFESMGFSCSWVSANNLLEVSGTGCNEEFSVEKMLKPIEAFLLYLRTHNIVHETSKFDDDCNPVK